MLSPGSPVIVLYGSSFPIWLFAAVAGVMVALMVRQTFIVTGFSRELPWPALFHPAVALLSGVLIYVIWIGGY